MALNQLGLGFLFTAKDQASGVIRGLSSNFQTLSRGAGQGGSMAEKAMVGLGAATATAGVGIGGLVAGFTAAGAFGEFEQAIVNVGVTMEATREEVDLLSKAAIKAGMSTQFSPTQAAEGLDALAAAGQSAGQAIETLDSVLGLVAASKGQISLGEGANAVVGTLNAYGLAAEHGAAVTDKLLLATAKSNLGARDFEIALSKAAAQGAQFDQSIETVLASLGFLRNANIDASSSATAFREAVRALGSDERAQQKVAEYGVEIFDKKTNQMRQLPDIVADFAVAMKDLSVEERNNAVVTAFGARGLLAYNAIAKGTFTKVLPDGTNAALTGKAAFDEFRKALENAGGTAEEMSGKMLDTWAAQREELAGSVETVGIGLGESFAEVTRPLIEGAIKGLNFFLSIIQAIPKPIRTLMAGAFMAASGFLTLAGGTGMLVAGIVLLLPVLKIVAITFVAVGVAMIPVIALFALGALAVVGFREAFDKNIAGIGSGAGETFAKISLGLQALLQFFSEGKISGTLAEDLAKAENEGVFNFVNQVISHAQAVINIFSGISTGFSAAIDAMGPSFGKLISAFERLVSLLGIGGVNANDASDRFHRFGLMGERVGAMLGSAFEFIVDTLTSVINWVSDLIEAFQGAEISATGLRLGFNLIVDALGRVTNALFGSSTASYESKTRMEQMRVTIEQISAVVNTLATVFGVVFSVIADFVATSIGRIKATFQLLMAEVDIIRAGFALLGGDVEGAFTLIKSAILRTIGVIVGKIAEVIDSIAKMQESLGITVPGINIENLQESVKGLRQSIADEMGEDKDKLFASRQGDRKVQDALRATAFGPGSADLSGTPGVAAASVPVSGETIAAAIAKGLSGAKIQGGQTLVKVFLDSDEISSRISKTTDDTPGGAGTGD